MAANPIVTKIEVTEFSYQLKDIGAEPTIGIPMYQKGSTLDAKARVVRVFTDEGVTGEYLGGSPSEHAAIPQFAKALLGKSALAREAFYNDAKQALRQHARMGMSQVDMALWDLAGKLFDTPVYRLLGQERTELPCYASTYVGDGEPDGLSTPGAYADFAEQCHELGYPAFKIHPWQNASIEKQMAVVSEVGKRVAGKMDLMLDPFCAYRTWGDAVKIGRVCDEWGYYWYEDPFRDGGVSAFAHKKLREILKTPILQTEHVRGLEPHMDFILAGGTDFVRIDQDYDGGITGVMKIAHAAESVGLDVEPHGPGPSRRQCMAAMRNSNYYEMGLVHPRVGPFAAPVYLDYEDQLDSIDDNGCVRVPDKPGLGASLDWDYINARTTDRAEYR
ncbi:MAG: enolase C-terminal domain-like protein [Chloroflexota bacterium]